jgi:hypothetical protein
MSCGLHDAYWIMMMVDKMIKQFLELASKWCCHGYIISVTFVKDNDVQTYNFPSRQQP